MSAAVADVRPASAQTAEALAAPDTAVDAARRAFAPGRVQPIEARPSCLHELSCLMTLGANAEKPARLPVLEQGRPLYVGDTFAGLGLAAPPDVARAAALAARLEPRP